MEVTTSLYSWLISIGALEEAEVKLVKTTDSNKVILDSETSKQIESGLKFSSIIKHLYSLKDHQDEIPVEIEALNKISEDSTQRHNWELIADALIACEIKLTEEEKESLIAGDTETIINFLENLKTISEAHTQDELQVNSQSRPERNEELAIRDLGVNILSLNISKDLIETENCLELLLIAMSRAFTIQPRQAAALLTEGGKYFARILMKGIKGEFFPVESFLANLDLVCTYFASLIRREELGTLEMVLDMLKAGLYSKDERVAEKTMKVLSGIVNELRSVEYEESLWNWFIENGLGGIVYSLQKHSNIKSTSIETIISFAGEERKFEVFTQFLRFAINNDYFYWQLVNILIAPFSKQNISKSFKLILSNWIESALRISENDIKYSVNDRTIALSIICEMWLYSSSVFESQQDLIRRTFTVLRRTIREHSHALQLYGLAQSFKLLEFFVFQKSSYAAGLYKSLALALLEMYQQEDIREFILANFKRFFATTPTMPINVVTDIMTKQLESSEDVSYLLNSFDLEFLRRIVTHQKLDLVTGVQFMDIFAKQILNDSIFAMIYLRCFRIICNRMRKEPSVLQLLSKCVNIIISALQINLNRYFQSKYRDMSPNELTTLADFNHKKLIKFLLIIQSIKDEEINAQLKEAVTSLYINLQEEFAVGYEPLKFVLKLHGEPDEIIGEAMGARELAKAAEAEERRRIAEEERERREEQERQEREKEMEREREKELEEELEEQKNQQELKEKLKEQGVSRRMELVLIEEVVSSETRIIPYYRKVNLNKKAKTHIELIKQRREEREAKKEEEKRLALMKLEKQKKYLQQQALRRNIELGIVLKSRESNLDNIQEELVREEEYLIKEAGNIQYNGKLELINLDNEELQDKEAILITLNKYKKTLRILFRKYINKCYKGKPQVFDSMRNNSELLSVGEFRMILNDHDLNQTIVSNDELNLLFRLINAQYKKPDLQTFTFDAFVNAFMQLAIYLHSKYGRFESCLPLVEAVNTLMKYFENAAKRHGENTIIYTNPEAASLIMTDQKLLKELNVMIEKAPNYPLPEGFKKLQYRDVKYTYELGRFSAVDESLKIAVEILDEILEKALGNHFIEPRMVFEQRVKVVPDQLRLRSGMLAGISRYPENISSSRYKKVRFEETRRSRTGSVALSKPKVPINTQLVIAIMPKEMQEIALEVGEVVEGMVKAVEEGKSEIPTKDKMIMNQAMKQQREKLESAARIEREKEEKRRRRNQELKKKLEEKKKAEVEFKSKPVKSERKEKELEELRKRINERTERRKQEKLKQIEEHKAKEKEEKEQRKKEVEYFLGKKKEELEKMFKSEASKRQKEKKLEEQSRKAIKIKHEKKYKQIESKLKADKEIADLLRQQNENVLKFMKQDDVVKLFKRYNNVLKTLFEYYIKSDKLEVNKNLEVRMTLLPYRSFIKLVNQQKLIPTIVTKDEIMIIYKLIMKNKAGSIGSLNFDEFSESLVRITIKGKAALMNSEENKAKENAQLILSFDLEGVTVSTIEKLFKYMKLSPGMSKRTLIKQLTDLQHEKVKDTLLRQRSPSNEKGEDKNEQKIGEAPTKEAQIEEPTEMQVDEQ